MTRDEMELLTKLQRLCNEAPAFAMAFPDDGLPIEDELDFGCRLVEVGNCILRHATDRNRTVIDPERGNEPAAVGYRQAPHKVIIDGTVPPADALPAAGDEWR